MEPVDILTAVGPPCEMVRARCVAIMPLAAGFGMAGLDAERCAIGATLNRRRQVPFASVWLVLDHRVAEKFEDAAIAPRGRSHCGAREIDMMEAPSRHPPTP